MKVQLVIAAILLLAGSSLEHCSSNSTEAVLVAVLDKLTAMEDKLTMVSSKQDQLTSLVLNNSEHKTISRKLEQLTSLVLINSGELKSLQASSAQAHSLLVPPSWPAGTRPATTPKDCSQLYSTGYRHTGIYAVRPADRASFNAWCSAGYTTLQRKTKGDVSFNRPWVDYLLGFGSLAGDHWLGLEYMHWLTKDSPQLLFIDLTLDAKYQDPGRKYIIASRFAVNTGTDYILTAQGISTNLKDMTGAYGLQTLHNGMKFTTKDKDQDRHPQNCAQIFNSGFWFNGCGHVFLSERITDCSPGNRVCGSFFPYRSATEEMKIMK